MISNYSIAGFTFPCARIIALNLNDDFVFVASTGEKTNLHVVVNKMQICRPKKTLVGE